MRKKLIMALIVANGMLAGGLMAFDGGGGQNCCREDSNGDEYCCEGCCMFIQSCDSDSDCMLN